MTKRNTRGIVSPRKRTDKVVTRLANEVSDDLVEPEMGEDIEIEIDEASLNDIIDARVEARMRKLERQAVRRRSLLKQAEEDLEDEVEDQEDEVEDEVVEDTSEVTAEEDRWEAEVDGKTVSITVDELQEAMGRSGESAFWEYLSQEYGDDAVIEKVQNPAGRWASKDEDETVEKTEELDANDNDEVSDDLVEDIAPDANDDNVQQTEEELPDSIAPAEAKVAAAYELLDARIAHGIEDSKVRKSAKVATYCKKYTTREMRLIASDLHQVGRSGKSVGGVRVAKRQSLPISSSAAVKPQISDDCLFA